MTDDDEKVCVTGTQMKNILDADREYARGAKKPKRGCPKAWDWVTKYHPIKEKKEKDVVEKIGKKALKKLERTIVSSIKSKLGKIGDLF